MIGVLLALFIAAPNDKHIIPPIKHCVERVTEKILAMDDLTDAQIDALFPRMVIWHCYSISAEFK